MLKGVLLFGCTLFCYFCWSNARSELCRRQGWGWHSSWSITTSGGSKYSCSCCYHSSWKKESNTKFPCCFSGQSLCLWLWLSARVMAPGGPIVHEEEVVQESHASQSPWTWTKWHNSIGWWSMVLWLFSGHTRVSIAFLARWHQLETNWSMVQLLQDTAWRATVEHFMWRIKL